MNNKLRLRYILGAFIAFSIVLTTIQITSLFNKRNANIIAQNTEIKEFQLFEYNIPHNSNPKESIKGIVLPSDIVEIRMMVDGIVESDVLTTGKKFKKDDVLIKLDRLELLYQVIIQRLEYKKMIQEILPQIKDEYPEQFNKWNEYEKSISQTENVSPLPKLELKGEEDLVLSKGINKKYYEVKSIENKAQEHYYIAPFSGYVLESLTHKGKTIKKGETLLNVARDSDKIVTAFIPIKDITSYNKETTFNLIGKNGNLLSKAYLKNWSPTPSDPNTVKATFEIESKNKVSIKEEVTISQTQSNEQRNKFIPESAVIDNQLYLYNEDGIFNLSIIIQSTKKDSVEVSGLPDRCFIITNPKDINLK